METPLRIECGTCVARGTEACDGCVVRFVVRREPGDALVIDAAQERELRRLAEVGLVPELRFRRTG